MKIKISLEFEVSDIPEQERIDIINDSGISSSSMPRISEMSEMEVRSEIIDAFYSMFNGADYDVQSEMWAGSNFYGYITGVSVIDTPDANPHKLEKRPAAFEVLDTENGTYLTRSEEAALATGFEYNGLYRRDSAEPGFVPSHPQSQAVIDMITERRRQIEAENWTTEHDDDHTDGSLALAAGSYCESAARSKILARTPGGAFAIPKLWPRSWSLDWWKPKSPREDLVKAGALIIAEIERLDRAAAGGEP